MMLLKHITGKRFAFHVGSNIGAGKHNRVLPELDLAATCGTAARGGVHVRERKSPADAYNIQYHAHCSEVKCGAA